MFDSFLKPTSTEQCGYLAWGLPPTYRQSNGYTFKALVIDSQQKQWAQPTFYNCTIVLH